MNTNSFSNHVKHLVFEIRYAPTLKYYPVIDEIGIEFADKYPDYERTPLTLELRNKKQKSRCYFSSRRAFIEAFGSLNEKQEFDRAMKIFDKLHDKLKFTKVERIGIRQWAAIPVEEKFADLVGRFAKKFNASMDELDKILGGQVNDIGYNFDVTTPNGWLYHLRFGPMEKKQWFEIVPHDRVLFESDESLKEYQSAFPDRVIFIDFDGYQNDVAYSDLTSVVTDIRRGTTEIMNDLAKLIMG